MAVVRELSVVLGRQASDLMLMYAETYASRRLDPRSCCRVHGDPTPSHPRVYGGDEALYPCLWDSGAPSSRPPVLVALLSDEHRRALEVLQLPLPTREKRLDLGLRHYTGR